MASALIKSYSYYDNPNRARTLFLNFQIDSLANDGNLFYLVLPPNINRKKLFVSMGDTGLSGFWDEDSMIFMTIDPAAAVIDDGFMILKGVRVARPFIGSFSLEGYTGPVYLTSMQTNGALLSVNVIETE